MKSIIALVFMLLLYSNTMANFTGSSTKDSVENSNGVKTMPWFVERFRLTAGFFVPVSNTNIQVGIKGGTDGSEIDFEKDLGFNRTQGTFLGNFQWRISPRSRFAFNYYNIPRNSTHQLDKEIDFNGQIYPVDATVKSFFNTAIYQISYGYAIVSKPKFEMGLMIGTHLVGGNIGISLTSENQFESASTDFGFTAPLPDLGLWGGYAINKKLAMNLDLTYLSLSVGGISGSIFAYNLLFVYKVIDKLDLSLGYSGLNFKVDYTKNDTKAKFDWSYNGPSLGVTYSFGKKSWIH